MASTIHELPKLERRPPTGIGDDGLRGMVPAGGLPRTAQKYAPPPASTGIWVILAAIGMTFAALTSALVVRKGGATDWRHFTLPSILYLNTLILLASSVTLEFARKRVAAFMAAGRTGIANPAPWLYSTLGLGLAFVAGQYVAWHQLKAQGLYLATNPSSSFFYVFTAAHALHLIGGLGGMVRVIAKLNNASLRRSTLDATSRYWHFMDVLWVYLLLLLWMKL
jgi:cytochrome c oxidase subunit III